MRERKKGSKQENGSSSQEDGRSYPKEAIAGRKGNAWSFQKIFEAEARGERSKQLLKKKMREVSHG